MIFLAIEKEHDEKVIFYEHTLDEAVEATSE